MIKDIGKRTAKNSTELTSILSEMILDASNEPAYASPYIRTATISYRAAGTWAITVELGAAPDPVPLADFIKKLTTL